METSACGTPEGYLRHSRIGEPPCAVCVEACVDTYRPEIDRTIPQVRRRDLIPTQPVLASVPDVAADRVATGMTGAISELVACADLMRRGWHVFRAQSPACPCDLIAMSDTGECVRVEVRTARISVPSRFLTVPLAARDAGRFDLFAVVVGDEVGYLGPHAPAPFPWRVTPGFMERFEEIISS